MTNIHKDTLLEDFDWTDITSVIQQIRSSGYHLRYAPKELQNDRVLVMIAISQFDLALEYASEELRNSKDIVLMAVSNSGRAFAYASKELQNDKDVALMAMKSNGMLLEHLSPSLKNDKDVVLMAMQQDPKSLVHASDNLQNDKQLLEILDKYHSNTRPFKEQYTTEYKKWYMERMESLELFKEQEWMENNIPNQNLASKAIKF